MDRKQKILRHIDLSKGTGLEIGALSTPVVHKSDSKIFYADHMSTEELKKKYKNEPVELNDIVGVDFVVRGLSLKETIGDKKFDYVIASHVIEHIPDMIRWFQDIAQILKKDGVLSLVIPDKRFTFDITRRVSSLADVIGAYIDNLTRTSSSVMYDYLSEYRTDIFANEIRENELKDFSYKPRRYSADEVWELTKKNAAGRYYVDAHCFVFTPSSFFEIIKGLATKGLFDFEIVDFIDTAPGELEFYVTLRKVNKGFPLAKKLAGIPKFKKPSTKKQLRAQINEMNSNLELTKSQLETVQSQLQQVLSSKSWRITKPLREIAYRLKLRKFKG